MQTWTVLFATLLAIGEICGTSGASGASGKFEIPEWGDIPFLVSFDVRGLHMECLGTIIKERWILTTASCIINPKDVNKEISIKAGRVNNYTNYATNVEIKVNVTGLFSHEKFNPTTFENDIGLIRLNESLKFNKFLYLTKLARSGEIKKSSYYVAGWGDLGKEFLGYTGIKYSKVNVSDSKTDNSLNSGYNCPKQGFYDKKRDNILFSKDDDLIMRWYSKLFGGPLLEKDPKGGYIQRGIISWTALIGHNSVNGDHCSTDSSVLVYTDVSLYSAWIQNIIKYDGNSRASFLEPGIKD